jgi:hypothetical protein
MKGSSDPFVHSVTNIGLGKPSKSGPPAPFQSYSHKIPWNTRTADSSSATLPKTFSQRWISFQVGFTSREPRPRHLTRLLLQSIVGRESRLQYRPNQRSLASNNERRVLPRRSRRRQTGSAGPGKNLRKLKGRMLLWKRPSLQDRERERHRDLGRGSEERGTSRMRKTRKTCCELERRWRGR